MTQKKRPRFPWILLFIFFFCAWFVHVSLIPVLPQPTEPPCFYSNQAQQDLRQVLLEAIRRAHSSISLVMFGLSDGSVLSLLSEKIHSGVSAQIYYDPNGSVDVEGMLGTKGVHPVRSQGLMHHKILVLDDATVFIGSANMTTHSLRMHDNLVLGLVNQKVARFLQDHIPTSSGYLRTMVGGQHFELWLLPDTRGKAVAALSKQIRSASRSIRLALFTLTHAGLVEDLLTAHRRGVEVSVVVDMHAGLGASASVVEKLRSGGVRLFFSQGTQLLHHKFAYIDEKILVMGSANWTKAAFTKNNDSLLFLHSLTETQKSFLNQLWDRIEVEAKQQLSK